MIKIKIKILFKENADVKNEEDADVMQRKFKLKTFKLKKMNKQMDKNDFDNKD